MPGNEFLDKEELYNILDIFTNNNGYLYRYGKGHYVKDFEKALEQYFDIKYAHCISSGSAALKLALQALGVGPGDEVITQSHTFIATVEAICEVGATPVIVDIDKSLNMSPLALKESITDKTKVVIPVHMSGVACDMDSILQCVFDINPSIRILEDNAQSISGTYHNIFLGTYDVGIFSFDFGKMLTTGEGGAIITNNEEIYKKVSGLSDHGHANNPNLPRGLDDCIGLGFNYKMNELQGAVGLAQLHKLNKIISCHKRNKQLLIDGIKDIVELRQIHDKNGDIGSCVSFFFDTIKQTNMFVKEWIKLGYTTFNLPCAKKWHCATYWNHIPYKSNGLKQTQQLLDRTVSIPIMAKYTEDDIRKRIVVIDDLVRKVNKNG